MNDYLISFMVVLASMLANLLPYGIAKIYSVLPEGWQNSRRERITVYLIILSVNICVVVACYGLGILIKRNVF